MDPILPPDTAPPAPPKYASLNGRTLASIIDLGIVSFIALPLTGWVTDFAFGPLDIGALSSKYAAAAMEENNSVALKHMWELSKSGDLILRVIFENLFQLSMFAVYTLPFWMIYSTSPGKILMRMTIRDATTGAPMTLRQSVIRFLGYFVSALPLTFGFFWVMFDKKKRGWHDYIANTVVLIKPRKKKSS